MNRYQAKKQKSPVRAIREFCIECMGGRDNKGSMKLVRECVSKTCALFEFRLGANPYHNQTLTKAQREERGQRLKANLISHEWSKKISEFDSGQKIHVNHRDR
jgi:hypothetical protein